LLAVGHAHRAENLLLNLCLAAKARYNINPSLLLINFLDRLRSPLVPKAKRRGRRIYQVPFPIPLQNQYRNSLKMIRTLLMSEQTGAVVRKDRTINSLLIELQNFYQGNSVLLKAKSETYKVLISNRAFSHYR